MANLGEAGEAEGPAVERYWTPLYLAGLLVPLLLFLVLLFRPANLNRHAWAVLLAAVPFVFGFTLLSVLLMASGEEGLQSFYLMTAAYVFVGTALACVWLLSDRLVAADGGTAFGWTWAVAAGAGVVSALSVSQDAWAGVMAVAHGVAVTVLLVALPVAARFCRRDYQHLNFVLYYAAASLLGPVLLALGLTAFIGISFLGSGFGTDVWFLLFYLPMVFVGTLLITGVFSFMGFAYVLLAVLNRPYRERLEKVLGLVPRAPGSQEEPSLADEAGAPR